MEEQEKRVRAWLVVSAEDIDTLQGHYKGIKGFDRDQNDVVIIRGDITDPVEGVYKLVVPIDVAETAYLPLIARIKSLVGIDTLEVLRVNKFNPEIAQDASGYITPDELTAGEEHPFSKYLKSGRQDYSPGYNPWG
ncbi:MAG: hypothetical protein U9N80_02025 [Chloroflexota bacterium]|nr:hypothetical protein [Chloroflexota bacterium]